MSEVAVATPLPTEEMRARLAAIVADSQDAIISKTLEGVVTSWNGGAERLFGYTAAEMIGTPIVRVIPQERLHEETEILSKLRQGLRIEHYETQRLHKDGRLLDVSLTISPMRDSLGTIIGASKIARDVSARKRADRLIADSEQRYRSLVEASGAIVFHADAAANWEAANPGWEAYTGQPPSEYRGHGWLAAVHPDDRERVAAQMRAAIAEAQTFATEGRLWHAPTRTWRHQEARAVPIRDSAGSVTAWVGTCLDVHARLEAEAALRTADRRKDEFLATMAHELRNPLAPLVNSLAMLQLGWNAQAPLLLEIANRQAETMVRLVDDLMEASRIARGLIELKLEPVLLQGVVEQAVDMARPLLDLKRHRLEHAIEPLTVLGDRTRLTQVVGNLLNNAAKYTPEGGHISIKACADGGFAQLQVVDNGTGIPAEMLTSIFEMFTQVDTSPERTYGGLGIGLSIVRRLVELHGGSVEAFSAGAGQGSEFTVRLPLAAGTALRANTLSQMTLPPRRRVLIADDNVDAATSLALLLSTLNQEVHVVHRGQEAVERAGALRPDLLLLDIGMPGMTGYDVARAVRSEVWGREPMIVAMTGWGQVEDRRRSREAGFDEHLVKPAAIDALCRVLHQAGAPSAP